MSYTKKASKYEERKKLLKKDLKEGLQGLKEIIVASLAIMINIKNSIPKRIKSSSIITYDQRSDFKKQLFFFQAKNSNNKEIEPVDIDVEFNKHNKGAYRSKLIGNLIYPILATISTTSLVMAVFKFQPLIQWANSQNECIEKTNTKGSKLSGIENKVMTCNGGHSN